MGTAERKRILLSNIYGVDIDSQAVEVTKLSLLLKVLEGETDQTLGQQTSMFKERALPNLSNNIKCGNSLIGSDFYTGQQISMLDTDEVLQINVFDWEKAFPEVFKDKSSGFDVVIGNPPYVRIQGFPQEQIAYFTNMYQTAVGNFDLYISFVEKGYNLLSKYGRLGFILPNKFFKTDYGVGLRSFLTTNRAITEIVDFGSNQVFDATTYTCLLFLTRKKNNTLSYMEVEAKPLALTAARFASKDIATLGKEPWSFADPPTTNLLHKISRHTHRLLEFAEMSRGSSSGNDNVFILEKYGSVEIEKDLLRTPIFASDFGRYKFSPAEKWEIIFPYVQENDSYRLYSENELRKKFPKASTYLTSHQPELKKRKQFKEWYGYSAPRNLELHDRAQIIVPLLANRGIFSIIPEDKSGQLCPMASGGFTITISPTCKLRPEYILGLLNSKLLFWILEKMSNVFRGGWITCTKQYFGELPIRTIDFSSLQEKEQHDHIAQLVERILALNKQLPKVKTPHEQESLKRQIEATDQQIDELVYELYGLSKEEIAIIENCST